MTYVPGGSTPPVRRGPHPVLALLSFLALIVVAMTIVLAVTSIGRLVR